MTRPRGLAVLGLAVAFLALRATAVVATVAVASATGGCLRPDCSAAAAAAGAPGENPPDAEARAFRVIVATNDQRAAAGQPPLKLQSNLREAAMWYAQNMADNGHFDHVDLQGRSPQQRLIDFGYLGNWTGENIARGYETAGDVMAAWMESSGHRANILRPQFREIGVGYGRNDGDTYRHYWVQNFGTQQNVFPVVINHEAPTTTLSTVALYIYGSGWAVDMRLRNDASTWTPWQAYASTVSWDLAPGAGKRIVAVELRSGREVRSAQDEIEVVGAGPGVTEPAPTATATGAVTEPPPASPSASDTATAPIATPTASATATVAATDTAAPTVTSSPAATMPPTVAPPTAPPTLPPTATESATATAPPTVPPAEPPSATPSPSATSSATRTTAPTATPTAPATAPATPTVRPPEPTATRGALPRSLFLPLLVTR